MTPLAPCDLVILGGTHVLADECMTSLRDGGLAIAGGRILAAGEGPAIEETYQGARVIDASGKIVMPGLINTHTHTPMTILRGYCDDMALTKWLEEYMWPWEHAHMNPVTVAAGTTLAIAEMVRAGITTFNDMYFFGMQSALAAREAGVRALVAEAYAQGGPCDFDSIVTGTGELVKCFSADPLITPAVAPHSLYAVGREQLLEMARLSEKHGLPLHIHMSETAGEVSDSILATGMRPPAYADSLGLLSSRTIAAHCVHLNDEEIDLLARRGAGVSHTPQSEMKLASGIARVPAMLEAGIAVGLGTDGAASNNVLDILQEAKAAALLHKVSTSDPTTLEAAAVVRMATSEAARCLGMDSEIGSLEAGKRADVIILDAEGPHAVPCYDACSHIAYVMKSADVSTVIIEGRVVMEDRLLATIDEEKAIWEVRRLERLTVQPEAGQGA